ncbi:hypothetical protein [Escherichia coli]|uniref:hypothetical protein n=1 Tax=Escherichia coli TaxID=562 RepID=UPI0021572455|nr:hypothetical protein [Escherichia coli]
MKEKTGLAGLGWAGLGWAGLGWAGLGWAGLGIVTAEAVTLFKSSLRCGASGAKRLPCPYRA